MDIKKSILNGQIYDVCDYDEYAKNPQAYNNVAIINNGYIYPVRKTNEQGPGFYPFNSNTTNGAFLEPVNGIERENYSDDKLIDFSGDMRQKVEAAEILFEKEKEILTNAENIFIPRIKDGDSPAMQLTKEAVIGKEIDFDAYKHRYGNNFNNTRKLFENPDITLKKMAYVAKGIDLKITLTIEDANPNVANPLGRVISKVITGDDE